ncbi:prephenate dehydratase [Methanocorpusculum vombati]|uniref:prephenate dehydratase n=1 Tax=Methanocorpusculum vombati TaxID=3002864 RepID=A0ABT4IJN5_9EURY|nr:prephenate dehydratase [Methanocorpusculum vombati]MCZ9320029.1 prephenate dehydratase [Methanocorpusculum sp.]MCZ0861950.1 prephenate dehydratase [Methanocorpusculum vombati]MDE2520070.1 prephenate dehydratase [Methanocorpusculum sp.]MDE2535263.1 prephenate dehydratase [Methanocorpusculum sp.]MDE2545796.1 prephenate dehydratase [Methanocorpusculum sp.]
MTTPRIEKVLHASIDKLYIGSEEFLAEIEAGLGTAAVSAPKVGYQGVAGSFGEQAALEYFGGTASAVTNYREFDDVFSALERGEIDYGVLPIENSTAGDVLEVADLITRCSLYVVGEHIIRVRHNLLGVSGASTETVREVYSHPQAISQCRDFLRHHAAINAYPYANTALAAKFIAETRNPAKASIGSLRAAELYGLDVLERNIQTAENNYTRFIILSRQMEITPQSDKISLAFSTAHKSGALYSILAHFAYNGLNLLKIQSRPKPDSPWEYVFFLDVAGNLEDANVLIALGKVREQSTWFKLVGNYPHCPHTDR